MNPRPRRAALALASTAFALTGFLSACTGGSENTATPPIGAADAEDDLHDVAKDAGVPEECAEPFPLALTKPDPESVELTPAGWPEPPVDAVLCSTSEIMDGGQESLDYATDASADEILAAYETALADFGATIDDQGTGIPMVVGQKDGTSFQVRPQDGGFVVFFAKG
jgi:hypothetical protein